MLSQHRLALDWWSEELDRILRSKKGARRAGA
jgi:hypothetical protein